MNLPVVNQGQKYKLVNTISTHYGTLHEGEVVRLDSVGYPEKDCRVVDSLGRAWFVNFDDMKLDGGGAPALSSMAEEKLKKKPVEKKSKPAKQVVKKPVSQKIARKKSSPQKTISQKPSPRKTEQKRQASNRTLPKKPVHKNVRKKR
tara:strand:+ start:1326 stop:1766 length:441 start_codon:yes stop_codon:yes gene_type:complete